MFALLFLVFGAAQGVSDGRPLSTPEAKLIAG
jgi:hypothetical protein